MTASSSHDQSRDGAQPSQLETVWEVVPAKGDSQDAAEDGFERLERHQVLEPGCYWRVKKQISAKVEGYGSHQHHFKVGDAHLLLAVHDFEGRAHSVDVLEHPRDGGRDVLTILIADFIESFDPLTDEEAHRIRTDEQAQIMQAMADVQEEMAQASINPLALPGVQEAAEKAVEKFEREEAARVQSESKTLEQRDQDLRRIHRRAARRSSAKGNPIAVRRTTISDRVDVMISEGISSDGVRELSLEAGRRIAIAEAAAGFLRDRTEVLSRYMKALTPYYAEKPQVALAKSRDAITLVKTLSEGIQSLKLYTGDDVTVITLTTGSDAPTQEPLALLQGKRFMDEEMAVWAHVEDSFDWTGRETFFRRLVEDQRLRDQVLPLPRCVVSMAVTRRAIDYGRDVHWYDALMNKLKNQQVFLLVRNGENVHVVYSGEPSHEASSRLFPTRDEMHQPFVGLDGTQIGLDDIRFAKSNARHDDLALHYKRFLILLCGLDHREQLFGDFYPREEGLKFMGQEFQSRYFRFVEDDDASMLLESGKPRSVLDWIAERNAFVRSGSRIVLAGGRSAAAASRLLESRRTLKVDEAAMPRHLVASASKGFHRIQIPCVDAEDGRKRSMANLWLDGPDAPKSESTWYLCVDRVSLADVRAYLYSRRQRTSNISWLRTLRRVEEVLVAELQEQAELRSYLRGVALEQRVHTEQTVDQAIDEAISTWRAEHRGADAPAVQDITQTNELLTLMFPAADLSQTAAQQALQLAQGLGEKPLRLVRTGAARFALYTEVPAAEREPYGRGICWGWVKRHSVTQKKGKLVSSSSSLVWIERGAQSAAEEVLHDWPEMDGWLQPVAEVVKLKAVADYLDELERAKALQGMLEAGGPATLGNYAASAKCTGVGIAPELFSQLLLEYKTALGDRTYYERVFTAIPVGMYQKHAHAAPVFLYAKAMVSQFIAHYGTPEQLEAFLRVMNRSRSSREELTKPLGWTVIGLTKPFRKLAFMFTPGDTSAKLPWLVVETRKPGGIKRKNINRGGFGFSSRNATTRRERREAGGQPQLSHKANVPLSLNRAFDTLMGTNPEPRRSFYKSVGQRIEDKCRFGWDTTREQREAQIKEERRKTYEPKIPAASHLSEMVWDPVRRRGVASKVFRGPIRDREDS